MLLEGSNKMGYMYMYLEYSTRLGGGDCRQRFVLEWPAMRFQPLKGWRRAGSGARTGGASYFLARWATSTSGGLYNHRRLWYGAAEIPSAQRPPMIPIPIPTCMYLWLHSLSQREKNRKEKTKVAIACSCGQSVRPVKAVARGCRYTFPPHRSCKLMPTISPVRCFTR